MIKKTLCFSNPAYLSMRNSQLVIKLPEVEKADILSEEYKKMNELTRPIEDIGVVVLDNKQITITQGALEALLENNCAVITCDSNHLPVGLLLPLVGNTTQNERFRDQLDASQPLRKQLWQQTMQYKIRNQAAVLSKCSNAEIKCMQAWANDVRSGDPDNYEARAAVYYWKSLFGHIPGFIRDREGVVPNNLLNYGYAILRAVVARSSVASGLLPTLGIHHHNRYIHQLLEHPVRIRLGHRLAIVPRQVLETVAPVDDVDIHLLGPLALDHQVDAVLDGRLRDDREFFGRIVEGDVLEGVVSLFRLAGGKGQEQGGCAKSGDDGFQIHNYVYSSRTNI